jgi:glutaconate CoA-transferase subunit A
MTECGLVFPDIESLAAQIPDGAKVVIPATRSGAAMAVTRALVRRGVKGLHLVATPAAGLQADLLIGAGCVAVMESAGVTLDEYGQAPAFVRAVKSGAIEVMDSTCPAILAALQAGEKGIPFIPLRGLIGSDLVRYRDDYKVIDNPFGDNDPVVVLPAIVPDIALFHVPLADRNGNLWIGKQLELKTISHAAKRTLVTVEEFYDGDLLADPRMVAGTIPALYVSGLALAEKGAWPLGLPGVYGVDGQHLTDYVALARSEDGFARYLSEHVLPDRAAAE